MVLVLLFWCGYMMPSPAELCRDRIHEAVEIVEFTSQPFLPPIFAA